MGIRLYQRSRRNDVRYLAQLSILLALFLVGLTGCENLYEQQPKPQPIEYTLQSPYKGTRTFAVAPTVNLSGSRDFDVLAVSDTLFEELQQVQGLNVLPVNKTLAAMQRLGIRTIDSPQMAQHLAEFLGADAIVIPAVSSYDPYNPPKIGMILQLYTARQTADAPPPSTMPGASWGGPIAGPNDHQPVSQVAAVFNASNQTVLRELRDFAQGRTQHDSALQDEKFLLDADAYTRFVCNAMTRRLIEVEKARLAGR
ncbi:MAG TPA: hypothetical protein VM008_01260 [Phycisphaerae bacterium]|nr:hypothetical protein [Phycisphaerae bacterium]